MIDPIRIKILKVTPKSSNVSNVSNVYYLVEAELDGVTKTVEIYLSSPQDLEEYAQNKFLYGTQWPQDIERMRMLERFNAPTAGTPALPTIPEKPLTLSQKLRRLLP